MTRGVSSNIVLLQSILAISPPGMARYQKPYSIRESGASRGGSLQFVHGEHRQPTTASEGGGSWCIRRLRRSGRQDSRGRVTTERGIISFFQQLAEITTVVRLPFG